MGHLFEIREQTIWSPSRDVALCFLAQVRHLESRLKVLSGLTEVMSDTIDVDQETLGEFLEKIAVWANMSNPSMRSLLRGSMVHLLAIVVSSGNTKSEELLARYPNEWAKEAKELALRAMTAASQDF